MTFYITISLICLVSFWIILFSLNNQKDSLEKQLKDTSSVNISITVVKILLIISFGVFCFGIYVTFNSEKSSSFISSVKSFISEEILYSPPTIFSDEWVLKTLRNLNS